MSRACTPHCRGRSRVSQPQRPLAQRARTLSVTHVAMLMVQIERPDVQIEQPSPLPDGKSGYVNSRVVRLLPRRDACANASKYLLIARKHHSTVTNPMLFNKINHWMAGVK